MTITEDTLLKDILEEYPWIKEVLIEKNPKIKLLFSPLGKKLLKTGTVADVSKRTGKTSEELIRKLNEIILSEQ